MTGKADRDLLEFAKELQDWCDYYQPAMYVDIRPSLRLIARRAEYAAQQRIAKEAANG